MLSSGFTNAPVTRLALVSMIASSIFVSIQDVKYLFCIEVVPHLWAYRQFWRMFIWQLCYLNSTEVLQAGMVLYSLRIIERLWGSRKFASFLLSTFLYTSLLSPLLLALLIRPLSLNTLNYLPAGPTAILFAILAQYHAAIPSTYKYNIATTSPSSSSSSSSSSSTNTSSSSSPSSSPTLRLTDKSTVYFLAIQLSLSQFPYSILPAATGWVIGHAWRAELLPGRISAWRIPGWMYGDASLDRRTRAAAGATRRRRSDYAGGAGGDEDGDAQRYEDLRRRLEGESRAAAAAGGRASGSRSGSGAGAQRQRTLAGQIVDRFRGEF